MFAPGLTTGYSCWPLPGVRQSVIENDAALLAIQVPALCARIDAAAEALRLADDAAKGALAPPAARVDGRNVKATAGR